MLGPFSAEEGSDVIVAGTGTWPTGSGTFSFDVPTGASVQQVIAYWEGFTTTSEAQAATDTVIINGFEVVGDRIGGPTLFFTIPGCCDAWTASYRADITGLDLVTDGVTNSIDVSGLDFDLDSDGLGLMVIVDDGSGLSDIQVQDGNDAAFAGFAPTLDTTVPVTYTFAASTDDRIAELSLFFGSIGPERPNVVRVETGGVTTDFVDQLGSMSGDLWDVTQLTVSVPAGATELTVQALSLDLGGAFTGNLEASLIWIASAFEIAVEDTPPGTGCTPGYWKNHLDSWGPTGFDPDQSIGSVFTEVSAAVENATLLDALNFRGGRGAAGAERILLRAAVAGLLNAAHPDVDYSIAIGILTGDVDDAIETGNRAIMLDLAAQVDFDNNAGCPLD